jgi:hypothetical protein
LAPSDRQEITRYGAGQAGADDLDVALSENIVDAAFRTGRGPHGALLCRPPFNE